jgi:hypothetical protein
LADDADDLRAGGVEGALMDERDVEHLPQRALTWPCPAGESLVYDDHVGMVAVVRKREVAAFDERRSDRWEVSRHRRPVVRELGFAIGSASGAALVPVRIIVRGRWDTAPAL